MYGPVKTDTCCLFTICEMIPQYCFSLSEAKWIFEGGKDRWEWAACSRRDTGIICKNLGLEDTLDWFSGPYPALQLRKLNLRSKLLSLETSTDLLQTETQQLSQDSNERSEPQKAEFKFSSLTEVCDKPDSPVLHIKKTQV